MIWTLKYLPEAEKDYKSLARSRQLVVDKAIKKVKTNSLPQDEGDYGKPLGHKNGNNLTGYLAASFPARSPVAIAQVRL